MNYKIKNAFKIFSLYNYIYRTNVLRGDLGMIRMVRKSTADISINFGGENEIEIPTLTITLNNILSILDEIVLEQNSDAFVKFKVTDTKKGSFEIVLNALIEFGSNFFTADNIEFANNCLSTLVNFFEIKSHLKGEQPQEVQLNPDNPNQTIIINNYGEIGYVNTKDFHQYSTSPSIDEKITDIFRNCPRESFNFKKEGKVIFRAESDEFQHLSKNIDTDLLITHEQVIDEIITVLLPTKVPYEGKSKWEFKYDKKIKASVNDLNFIKRFQNGEIPLPPKASLKVKMIRTRNLDETGETIKEDYVILEVLEIILAKSSTSKDERLSLF